MTTAKDYKTKKERGLCMACTSPREPGKLKCSQCLKKASDIKTERYNNLKTLGLCQRCGKGQPEPGRTRCLSCRDHIRKYHVKYNENRRKNNICRCGSEIKEGGLKICNQCREAHSKRNLKNRQRKKAAGICHACSKKAEVGSQCLDHWFVSISVSRGGPRENITKVKELWKQQGGKCAYTGIRLVPEIGNASLDHVIPVSRGGLSDGNLEWVASIINHMKGTLTREEFIDICRFIVQCDEAKNLNKKAPLPSLLVGEILSRPAFASQKVRLKKHQATQPKG